MDIGWLACQECSYGTNSVDNADDHEDETGHTVAPREVYERS